MAAAAPSPGAVVDGATLHMILRFATGTAGAFIVSEAMGWYPSFLPPLLAGVLLANLPTAPPFKLGVVLILDHHSATSLAEDLRNAGVPRSPAADRPSLLTGQKVLTAPSNK